MQHTFKFLVVPVAAMLLQGCAEDQPVEVIEVRNGVIVDPCVDVIEFAAIDGPDGLIALEKCIDIETGGPDTGDSDTGDSTGSDTDGSDTGDTDATGGATSLDSTTSAGTWGSVSDTADVTSAGSIGDVTGGESDSASSISGGESGGGESNGGESGGGDSNGGESGGGESNGGESGGGESDNGESDGGDSGGGEAGGDEGGGGDQPVAWSFAINTKSFIGPLAWGGIGAHPGGILGAKAPYLAFAAATDAAYKENPPSGLMASGQYRLFGSLLLAGSCTVGSKNIVVTDIDKKGWAPTIFTDGGQEIGPIYGAVNKTPWKITRVKDANGDTAVTISYVISGHPNLVLEPSFQLIWPRLNRDIWHRVEVTFTCDPKSGAATASAVIQGSTFPSHRLWIYGAGAKLLARTKIVVQGAFNTLWSLPAVPAP